MIWKIKTFLQFSTEVFTFFAKFTWQKVPSLVDSKLRVCQICY